MNINIIYIIYFVVASRLPLLHGFVALTDAGTTHPQIHTANKQQQKTEIRLIIQAPFNLTQYDML